MKPDSELPLTRQDARQIAATFVAARLAAQALDKFPGAVPPSLDAAYRIQDLAIEQWPEPVGGWKVGRIPPALEASLGIDRLAGPIFADTIEFENAGKPLQMPIFDGGFAAVEAEFVAVVDRDAPAGKTDWTMDEAAAMISDLRIGLEIASSPLATINALGPPVVVSDFGNNAGLIVGPSIRDWRSRALETMRCETFIGDRAVGQGGAFTLTGGFVRSVQFLLELMARRGRPLRAGEFIATGQTNGIHDVRVGETSRVSFGADGELICVAVAASAR